jgi:hypothetical protein
MGFRNPATTAEGVDTGENTTGPGVRVYQDTTGPLGFPRGVVEFRDGIAGDAHATLTRTVNVVDAGGGAFTTAGGTFALDGGSINGVPAGGVRMVVEEDPAGGYRSALELVAGQVRPRGPLTYGGLLARSGIPSVYGAGWSRYSAAGGNPALQDAALWRLPDGTVRFQGLVQYVGGAGAAATIYSLPTEWRPKTLSGKDLVLGIVIADAFRTVNVSAGGPISLRGALPAAAAFVELDLSWPGPDYLH